MDLENYRHLHGPDEAVIFFAFFGRFEFALKRGGFCKGAPGSKADPGWDCFANVLGQPFFEAMRAAPEVQVLFVEPPRVQKVDAQREPFFEDQVAATNAAELFVAVRRVRNNLFHGEKVSFTHRDQMLVWAGLHVLDAALIRCGEGPLRQVGIAFAYAGLNQNP